VIKKPLRKSKKLILTILLGVFVLLAIVFYQELKTQVIQTTTSFQSIEVVSKQMSSG
jgi:hypothetical protein